jgi:hypothetical protein
MKAVLYLQINIKIKSALLYKIQEGKDGGGNATEHL